MHTRLIARSCARRSESTDFGAVFPSVKRREVISGPERIYVPPWREARSLERVVDELRAETGVSHALHGVGVELMAANLDAGESLLETKAGPDAFAVVRLTPRAPGLSPCSAANGVLNAEPHGSVRSLMDSCSACTLTGRSNQSTAGAWTRIAT